MSKKNIKTTFQQLQEILISIMEVPERLNRIDTVTKKELLKDIGERKNKLMGTYNDILILNANYTFEWFENNVSQFFFTFKELKRLEDLIQKSIVYEINRNEFAEKFNSPGLELFDYLNKNFTTVKAPTTKYTILFHFLRDKYIVCSNEDYLKFVKSYCNIKQKFTRLDFVDPRNEKYVKHEQNLTWFSKEFLKLNTIE